MNLASLNLNFNLTNFETCQISACFGELAPHSLFGIINVVVAKMGARFRHGTFRILPSERCQKRHSFVSK